MLISNQIYFYMKRIISLTLLCAVLMYSTTSCSKQAPELENENNIELTGELTSSFDTNIQNIISLREKNNNLSTVSLALHANNNEKYTAGSNKIELLEKLSAKTNSIDIINSLAQENIITLGEKEIFINLSNEISYSKNPDEVVKRYSEILKQNGIYNKFEGVILAMAYTAKEYPQIISLQQKDQFIKLHSSNKQARFLTSCAGASVGLALAFVGLAASGASVIGAGIGAAGFIYASAQWGASCR